MSSVGQRSFASGEIAPALYARTDISKYGIGLRTCRNMIILRHGGASNRPGTTYRGEVYDSSKTIRLIPFIFNADQTYVLEFGNQYIQFWKDGDQISDASWGVNSITVASPGVLLYTGGVGDPSNGDVFLLTDVSNTAAPDFNDRYVKVANVNTGTKTFEMKNLDGTNFNTLTLTAFSGGGGTALINRIYRISTTYLEADLQDLRFVQSADTITIVHSSYAPMELVRTADDSWTLTATTFAPTTTAPATVTNNGAGGTSTSWKVTAVNNETGEESLPSAVTESSATPSSGAPITINIAGVFAAPSFGGITPTTTYKVYRRLNGIYGFIGSATSAGTATFSDVGITPDINDTPPEARNPFGTANNYPTCVTYYQNRRVYGNTNNLPETTFSSKTGLYKNFTVSNPSADDDAVTWTMVGKQVNQIKHLLELRKLLLFTGTGEWSIQGNASGALTPDDINPANHSQNGSSELAPLIVGGSALYVQSRANIVRDLAFNFQTDGYQGNDLTIFSAHLFDGFTIRDWAYQQIPQSIVWAVRDDGALIGLTYIREQQLLAWHRHDFQGDTVEQVCVVPEGTEDALYLVVKRTVNGATKRYIERMETRNFDEITDAIFMDCAKSYDGTNTGSTTMTLSGGTDWTYTEDLTLDCSDTIFAGVSPVGQRIDLTGSDGTVIRCTIKSFFDNDTVIVNPNKTVPVSMRNVAITIWTRCIKNVTGLQHLEGKIVSVIGDGYVVASPNNASFDDTVTVASGVAALAEPYGIIHVGLPIISDLETLDIDQVQGESLADKKKLITRVSAFVQDSRGIWAGPKPPSDDDDDPLENLTEYKTSADDAYNSPTSLVTDNISIDIRSEWNSNGRVFIRQVDPLPMTILSIVPTGLVPYTGGK